MRIAEIVANFPPYFGGIGNSCLSFSKYLLGFGNEVHVYTSNYPNKPYVYPEQLHVHRLKYQFKYGNAPLLMGLFKLKNFDVMHLHYPFYFGAEIILIVSKLKNIPYAVTYHMDMVGTGFLRHIFSLHKRLLLRPILANAAKIYVSSYDYAAHSDLAKYPDLNHKIEEIPFGVDAQIFEPKRRSTKILKQYNIRPNEKVVLFVGQLDRPHYFKGVPILLEAFARLKTKNVRLLIAGGGDLQASYEQIARNLNLGPKVIFAGTVPHDALNEYFSVCTCSVLPSIDRTESFGMVLLEAQAAGKAVIASDFPGVRSVVINGQDGLLCKPNNPEDLSEKIDQLLSAPSTAESYGKNGRRKVLKKYTWEKVTAKLNNSLQAIVTPNE